METPRINSRFLCKSTLRFGLGSHHWLLFGWIVGFWFEPVGLLLPRTEFSHVEVLPAREPLLVPPRAAQTMMKRGPNRPRRPGNKSGLRTRPERLLHKSPPRNRSVGPGVDGDPDGRTATRDDRKYRQRNTIERLVGRLKERRRGRSVREGEKSLQGRASPGIFEST